MKKSLIVVINEEIELKCLTLKLRNFKELYLGGVREIKYIAKRNIGNDVLRKKKKFRCNFSFRMLSESSRLLHKM